MCFRVVRPCRCPSVRASVIHVVVLCFHDISRICWRIFAKLLSLVHLGTDMNWLDFGVKRSNLVQGYTIVAEAHSTRCYRRVQLFLVVLCSHSVSMCIISKQFLASVVRRCWISDFHFYHGAAYFWFRNDVSCFFGLHLVIFRFN